jgi:hypothetical protein
MSLMYGNAVNSEPVISAELYYYCTFIPVLGSVHRTIVTATYKI